MNEKTCNVGDVGGQALSNGLMMRSSRYVATAIRSPDGSIKVKTERVESLRQRYPLCGLPFVRGPAAIAVAMWVLLRRLSPSMIATMVAIMVAGNFLLAPLHLELVRLFSQVSGEGGVAQMLSTFAAFSILVGLLGLHPLVKRFLQYHGAEHQTIYAVESQGLSNLTPESASHCPLAHPRCGTTMFAMYLISVSLISPLLPPTTSFAIGTVVQFLLLFPIVSVWFEVIDLTRSQRWGHWARLALTPGTLLQRLTVKKPDLMQLEVAIAAMRAVIQADEKEDASNQSEAVTPGS